MIVMWRVPQIQLFVSLPNIVEPLPTVGNLWEPKGKVALLVPPLALSSSYVSRITRYSLGLPGKREI